MSTPETLIQEIDRLMEGITPGDWFAADWPSQGWTVCWRQDAPICHMRWTDGLRPETEARVESEAQFIAAAPRLLRAAKAEILRQQEELARLRALEEDAKWRHRWHARLGRGEAEPEGQFYKRIQRAAQPTGEGAAQEPQPIANWLIYDKRSECYWGPNRGGYFKSLASAGLYTEAEARAAEDFAKRYDRAEVAIPLEEHRERIERLHAALGPRRATPAPQEHTPAQERER